MSYSSVPGAFPKTQTPVVDVEHIDISACGIDHRVIVRGTYIENSGAAVIAERVTDEM